MIHDETGFAAYDEEPFSDPSFWKGHEDGSWHWEYSMEHRTFVAESADGRLWKWDRGWKCVSSDPLETFVRKVRNERA